MARWLSILERLEFIFSSFAWIFSIALVGKIKSKNLSNFHFFRLSYQMKERDVRRSMLQLTWLSRQFFSRYYPSKTQLKFSFLRGFSSNPSTILDFWCLQIECHLREKFLTQMMIQLACSSHSSFSRYGPSKFWFEFSLSIHSNSLKNHKKSLVLTGQNSKFSKSFLHHKPSIIWKRRMQLDLTLGSWDIILPLRFDWSWMLCFSPPIEERKFTKIWKEKEEDLILLQNSKMFFFSKFFRPGPIWRDLLNLDTCKKSWDY